MNQNELILNTSPFRAVFVVGPTSSPDYDGNPLRDVAAAIAQESAKEGMPLVLDGFNIEMRERCHAAYKLYSEDGMPAPWFQFEGDLNEPTDYFNGLTPAVAYSRFMDFCHNNMGQGILGQWVVERANFFREKQRKQPPEQRAQGIITADLASAFDYRRVVETYGAHNVTLVQVQVPGGGIDLSTNVASNIDADRKVVVRFNTDEAELVRAVREAAPHLFIKIATQF